MAFECGLEAGRVRPSHPATWGSLLLAAVQVSSAVAAEWLSLRLNQACVRIAISAAADDRGHCRVSLPRCAATSCCRLLLLLRFPLERRCQGTISSFDCHRFRLERNKHRAHRHSEQAVLYCNRRVMPARRDPSGCTDYD